MLIILIPFVLTLSMSTLLILTSLILLLFREILIITLTKSNTKLND
jgi:hypothetical protein